jgi:integrase
MKGKRNYGGGVIVQRGPNTFRIRYFVNKKRVSVTVTGTRQEARRRLRELLGHADTGTHVTPSKMTLAQWAEQWLLLLRRGEASGKRRRGLVSPRTAERYAELLDIHVLPTLGDVPVQQLNVNQIDAAYIAMEERGLSSATVRHAHIALGACLNTAVRKGHLRKNPAADADVPAASDAEIGMALDADAVQRLIAGFRGSVHLPIVTVALTTGLRRSEILALRWQDIDFVAMTLSVRQAIETTKEFGRVLKEPKSKRSFRTIKLEASTVALLQALHAKHLRLRAGVGEGAEVDLRLIKLPAKALVFPSPPAKGVFDFTKLRNGDTLSREICERFRKLGFMKLRFQDLRATHSTALLDAGVPLHTVAARMGNTPAVLLKSYAKRTKKAATGTAEVLDNLAASYGVTIAPPRAHPL